MMELTARIDEQKKLGKALLKFLDEQELEIAFLSALREILEDMAKGMIDTSNPKANPPLK